MSFLFPSSPKPQSFAPPSPPPLPPLPTRDDAAVEARRREMEESSLRKRRGGFGASGIRTSGLGDTSTPLIERKSALLG